MNDFNVNFPYQIGTYLTKEENGNMHIDQIFSYYLDKDGIYAILILDVLKDPRLSTKIKIEKLLNDWVIYDLKQRNR